MTTKNAGCIYEKQDNEACNYEKMRKYNENARCIYEKRTIMRKYMSMKLSIMRK